MNIQYLETQCSAFIITLKEVDAAHDVNHTQRVVENARSILDHEEADQETTIAAAWLHDCVVISKNDPASYRASELAADKATTFLRDIGFKEEKIDGVAHAIHAHSFSADIKPKTPEAKIVQDADRLDALGAVGIARCFTVGGGLQRPLYEPKDPFCENRSPDDSMYTLDHFYTKLLKLPELMNTKTGAVLARERLLFMNQFLGQFRKEIKSFGLD